MGHWRLRPMLVGIRLQPLEGLSDVFLPLKAREVLVTRLGDLVCLRRPLEGMQVHSRHLLLVGRLHLARLLRPMLYGMRL